MERDAAGVEADLIRRCLAPGAGRALEVGCGDGRLTTALAPAADSLTALDSWPEGLAAARARFDKPPGFAAASGEALPFAAGGFDTVVFTLSLHHQRPRRALAEAGRVLEPGGRILVLEPVADSLLNRLFAVIDDESATYRTAAQAIAESGFEALGTGAVPTRWVFEDFIELVAHICGFFDRQPDRAVENRMGRLLGSRRGLKPLPVPDETRYWLLGA